MKVLYKKTHLYFFLSSIISIALSYKPYIDIGNSALDINIHDTYFVISGFNFYFLIALFFAFIGIIYYTFHRTKFSINRSLTNIHSFGSIGCFFAYGLRSIYFGGNSSNNFPLFDNNLTENKFISVLLVVFLLVQIVFILNIISSTIKKFNS